MIWVTLNMLSAADCRGVLQTVREFHIVWRVVTLYVEIGTLWLFWLLLLINTLSYLLTYLQTQYDTGLLRILLTCCYMMLTEHNLLAIAKCLVDISWCWWWSLMLTGFAFLFTALTLSVRLHERRLQLVEIPAAVIHRDVLPWTPLCTQLDPWSQCWFIQRRVVKCLHCVCWVVMKK